MPGQRARPVRRAGTGRPTPETVHGVPSPTQQNHLHRIRAASKRMGELIDDLMELSRVSLAELTRNDLDLSELARSIAEGLAENEPDRQVTVQIQDGLVVQAGSQLIRAALENLLGNAWKFTAKIPVATVQFGAEVQDGATVYFVRDNGAGFDMKYAQRLFNPFQRLHSEDIFPGTGIGLATVRRIVERHGGRVWAEAGVAQGATFRFTIPVPPVVSSAGRTRAESTSERESDPLSNIHLTRRHGNSR